LTTGFVFREDFLTPPVDDAAGFFYGRCPVLLIVWCPIGQILEEEWLQQQISANTYVHLAFQDSP
jgi:hypothetical protein